MKGRQSGMPEEETCSRVFDAARVLEALELNADSGDVVEFGCGYGLFTEAACRRTTGMVYALDIEREMIEATRKRLVEANLTNFQGELRDFLAEGSGLPDQSVGYAMLFNILHIEEPGRLLREAYRTLIPGGKLGIIHWNYDPTTPRGPSMDIRPRPEQCRQWAEEAGFRLVRPEPLACCAHHYGLVMERIA